MFKRYLFNKNYLTVIALLLVSVFSFNIRCGNESDINAGDEKVNINPVFNETAQFLAGKEIPRDSKLYQFSRTKEYINYCKQIESNWEKLQDLNAKKITGWREKYLPAEYTNTVYYPFSGPDILNALMFFPDGKEFLMFGLEPAGEIPQPQNIDSDKLYFGLKGLGEALGSILYTNFFKTKDMQKEISTNDLNSIISVIMFFLARTNNEVLDVKKVWIDEQSAVVSVKPEMMTKTYIPGAEIYFRKANGTPVKKAVYFTLDISNPSLKNHKNYISYIESKGRLTTIIKSASYLMHRDIEFDTIRNFILSQSDFILQDDSGIPLRCFPDKEWKLSYYGIYIKPITLFAVRYQDDLRKAVKENSAGPLEFSYGYNSTLRSHNLMFAERIKK